MFVLRNNDATYYDTTMRRAYSYDREPAKAPLLRVEFTTYDVVPCVVDQDNSPPGCHQRIKKCEDFKNYEVAGATVAESETHCATDSPLLRDTIKPENFHTEQNLYWVKFRDGIHPTAGQCWGIVMRGGECWGANPINGNPYDCNGKCGGSCKGTCNWGRDCLRHDVCSWFHGATGGPCHEHCGDEFGHDKDDLLACCTWPCQRRCKGTSSTCGSHSGRLLEGTAATFLREITAGSARPDGSVVGSERSDFNRRYLQSIMGCGDPESTLGGLGGR